MLHMFSVDALRNKLRNGVLYLQMAVLAIAGVAPILNVGSVNAEQLTSRKVTIATSKPAETGVGYDFQFSWAGTQAPASIIIQFCNDPLGTCTLPGSVGLGYAATGKEMDISGASYVSSTNFPTALSTQVSVDTGACTAADGGAAATMLCFNTASGVTGAAATNATFNVTGITNPGLPDAVTNKTVYARVTMYSAASFSGTTVLEGTVATSINQQLTVSGRVQERLNFCVAAIQDNGSTDDLELPANVNACATPGATIGSVIDLGVIDNSTISRSPVADNPPTTLGNARYGVAMLNTNASNGTAITYFAEDDVAPGATNQLKAFRVPGATCNATASNLTDQCFVSAAGAGTTFVAGTEMFGMNVPCVIQAGSGSLPTSVTPTTGNLEIATSYNGDGTTTSAPDCEKSEAAATKYAWNTTSTAEQIAVSSVAGSKVVDNEIVKLNFGATAGATTPTGSYTVVSTYIATPTF